MSFLVSRKIATTFPKLGFSQNKAQFFPIFNVFKCYFSAPIVGGPGSATQLRFEKCLLGSADDAKSVFLRRRRTLAILDYVTQNL